MSSFCRSASLVLAALACIACGHKNDTSQAKPVVARKPPPPLTLAPPASDSAAAKEAALKAATDYAQSHYRDALDLTAPLEIFMHGESVNAQGEAVGHAPMGSMDGPPPMMMNGLNPMNTPFGQNGMPPTNGTTATNPTTAGPPAYDRSQPPGVLPRTGNEVGYWQILFHVKKPVVDDPNQLPISARVFTVSSSGLVAESHPIRRPLSVDRGPDQP